MPKKPRTRSYSEYVGTVIEDNKLLLVLFFKNNRFLLSNHGMTEYAQIKHFSESGVRVDKSYISRCRRGQTTQCSITFLGIFCKYWGKSLADMISYDMEERDKMLKDQI